MKLSDMKRTKAEKKAREEDYKLAGPAEEDYPHGTRIRLEHEDMEKLGMKDTPKPGSVYRIEAHGKVTHSHESADEKGKRRHVEIHLTKMGAEPKSDGGSLRADIESATQATGQRYAKAKEGKPSTEQDKGSDGGGGKKTGKGTKGMGGS